MTEIDLTPITRLEYDIDAILNDHAVAEPITRIELILADIVAGNTTTVEPVTRIETYLAIISGADYPVPEPVTRIETFLAIIAGEDYETPEAVTRLEGLLAEWVEKGSGIWKTVTGTLLHITDALASPMQKCEVTLEPIQDLHGQDAPYPAGGGRNVLNIADTLVGNDWLITNITYTIRLGQTFYVSASITNLVGSMQIQVEYTKDGTIQRIFGNSISTASGKLEVSGAIQAFDENTGVYLVLKNQTSASVSNFFMTYSSDHSYAPYSNICPITGWTGCEVWVKDEYDTSLPATASVTFPETVYGGKYDFVGGSGECELAPLVFDNSAWGLSNDFFYKTVLSAGVCVNGYYITENGVKIYLNGYNGQARIYLADNSFLTSDSDIGALLNGYKLLYELATPIEIQLTPQEISTLAGENNVWSNSNGETTIIYKAKAE